jgi:F-type H+-transporting ATPase subunit gamma
MPNLLDIRRRIKSVKNTQQITKAMKMVSAARLRRAQERVVTARPFANKMTDVLGELAKRTSEDFHHPLLDLRGDQRYVLVLVTADKGLCGAFNTNLTKAAQAFMRDNSDKSVELVAIGRKGRDFFRNRRAVIAGEFLGVTGKERVDFSEALEIARSIIKLYTEDTGIDKVFLVYNEFKSVMVQRVVVERLLPIARLDVEAPEGNAPTTDYISEPAPEQLLTTLIPTHVEVQVFRALLESNAAFYAAQMTAMDAATRNSGEMIEQLTLHMNKVRQAAITREIIEVVSGAQAL